MIGRVTKHIFFDWFPRVMVFTFVLFLSFFALDVFDIGLKIPNVLIALLIHIVPSLLILAVLFMAWKHEQLLGILLIIISGLFLLQFGQFFISSLLFGIGTLFLLNVYIVPQRKN